jgi:hypothetical protein
MKKEDYPALYQAASNAASRAQIAFLRCVKGYGALSIAGAGLAAYGIDSAFLAICAAALFVGALGLSLLMAVMRYENTWYRARAVAESIKTSTWRFMMRAEPFADDAGSANDKKEFSKLLRNILEEHKDLSQELAGKLSQGEQISGLMLHTRQQNLSERIETYREHRINEQREWYADKSETNKTKGQCWFSIFIFLQILAIAFTILRIGYPSFKYWPIEISLVAATAAFGWIRTKKFGELAAAYGLAAHEIGLASAQLPDIKTDEAFSIFVADTESAFSREHTQWIARRDGGI